MSTQAALGQKALEAKTYSDAIKHYTEALKSSNSPLWLTQRSTAYQREGAHELALHDAEDAVLSAISRGKRELIAAAQMRRAIALYSLGRYGDARLCFTWVRKLNEKEKGLGMWQAKVVAEYEKLDEAADGRKVTIKEVPDKVDRTPKETESKATTATEKNPAADTKAPASGGTTGTTTTAVPAQTPKDKIRHEWYQSSSKVTITIFAKNVPKDQADIQIGPQSLDVSFPTGSGSNYDFTLLPLFAAIDTSQSIYSIMSTKIEIILHKAVSGLKWPALEGTATAVEATTSGQKDSPISPPPQLLQASDPSTQDKPPAYPTSSRKGAKNWDAVAKDALKKEKKDAKDGETATNDDDDLDDEGDPLQGFFKKLYKDASPDTRRAMMKSYVESNGTALSTDWEDVGKKTVPINPPDGIEAKKWES